MYSGATSIDTGSVVAMIIYLLFLMGMGLVLKNRIKNNSDFWVGGRSVGPFATAFSFCAAYYSTVAVIGGPATKASYGLGYDSVSFAGNLIVTCFLMFVILGLRMRVISERVNAVSMPGFLATRYESNAIRIISAVITAVMMIPYGMACFKGIGDAMQTVAGIPYKISVLIIAVTALIYIVSSGYWGVATTDIVQGICIFLGITAIMISIIGRTGGWTEAIAAGVATNPEVGQMPGPLHSWPLFFSYALIWVIIGFGQPHLTTKFMGLKDSSTIKTVVITSTIYCAIFGVVSATVAMGGRALFSEVVDNNMDLLTPMAAYTSGSFIIKALFLCSCVAAGLSTIAAQVMSAASSVAVDIVQVGLYESRGKKLDSKTQINISRIATGIVIILMVVLSLEPWDFVWQLSTMGGGTMGAAFVAPLTLGIYYKKATKAGGIAAMIGGAVTTIGCYVFGLSGAIHPFMPGLLVSVILFYVVSAFTQKPEENTVRMFFDKNWRPSKSA